MHQCLQGATFHVEHIVPRAMGGTDDLENLALACPSCNLYKADRIEVKLSQAGKRIALFHPRHERWTDHFDWQDCVVMEKTLIGRATIVALKLNHPRRKRIRGAEKRFGLFPPDSHEE